jgi:hypothetical protein
MAEKMVWEGKKTTRAPRLVKSLPTCDSMAKNGFCLVFMCISLWWLVCVVCVAWNGGSQCKINVLMGSQWFFVVYLQINPKGHAPTTIISCGCGLLWMVGYSWLRLVGIRCGWLWLVVAGCGWLWLVVADCGWLWMVVDGCGWLWMVVDGCGWLWMVVDGCGWLSLIVDDCGWLWMVVAGCGWLWLVVAGCGWLWMVVAGCGWLWLVVDGCGWLWLVADGLRLFALKSAFQRDESQMFPVVAVCCDSCGLLHWNFAWTVSRMSPTLTYRCS